MSDSRSDPPPDGAPDAVPGAMPNGPSEEVRPIENPPEIIWADSRSLLLTLRHAQRMLRTDPDLVEDLLSLAYVDARQIVEDADQLVRAVRGRVSGSALRKVAGSLAESIEGELEGDDAADEQGGEQGDEQGEE